MRRVKTIRNLLPIVAAGLTLLLLAGCTVKTNESRDDKGKKNVDIQTPWGGLSVRTDPDIKDTGLPMYPNARRKPGTENDRHAANVDINTPMFGLRVVAIEFVSDDTPEHIVSFYRDKMKSFGGKFLECTGTSYVTIDNSGKGFGDDEDQKELTCGKHHGEAIELKAGVPADQHIVAIKPSGKGSEFALVVVQKHGSKGSV